MSKKKGRAKSKKFVLKSFTFYYGILQDLSADYMTVTDLAKNLKSRKQNVSYWLTKMLEEGLVTRPHRGIYEITSAGKNLLGTLERQNNKDLIRLENMRYKYPIQGNIRNLQPAVSEEVHLLRNNVLVYQGEEAHHTYRIFVTNRNPCLEVNCPPRYGYDIYEMMYQARNDNEAVAQIISDNRSLQLGIPEPSMKPEWAIPSTMAEEILDWTSSSQIRTPAGTINRSKGRNVDLETRDIRLAHDILVMPHYVRKIHTDLENLMRLLSYRSPLQIYNSVFF